MSSPSATGLCSGFSQADSMEELMLKFRILILGVLVALASTIAWAQTGSIQGTVSDQTGAVVQNA